MASGLANSESGLETRYLVNGFCLEVGGVDLISPWGQAASSTQTETDCQTECLSFCGSLYSLPLPHCLSFLLGSLVICKLVHNSFVCSVAPPAFFSHIFSTTISPTGSDSPAPPASSSGPFLSSPRWETLRSLASFVCFSEVIQKKKGRTVGLDW